LPGLGLGQNNGYSQTPADAESGAAPISLPSGQSPYSGSVAQVPASPQPNAYRKLSCSVSFSLCRVYVIKSCQP